MFSAKVITGIQIFSELEPLRNKKEGISNRKCAVSSKEIVQNCTTPDFVVKSVLVTMLRCGWLDKNYRGYFLLVNPSNLTLYDMYIKLHDGIPMGEYIEGSSQNNLYRHLDKWSKVVQTEDEIMQNLISVLKNTRFADIITCVEG